MTEIEEMAALADHLEGCVTRSGGIDLRDPKLLQDAAKALRSASRTGPGFAVKPLEWIGNDAKTVLGLYSVVAWTSGAYTVVRPTNYADGKTYSGITAAKAAAQSDYEQRIKSAIAALPAPAGTTTGWQPIETAPKDGTPIIGAFWSIRWADSHRKGDVVTCWWQPEFEAFISSCREMTLAQGLTFENGSSRELHSPVIEPVTHWKLLDRPTITRKSQSEERS